MSNKKGLKIKKSDPFTRALFLTVVSQISSLSSLMENERFSEGGGNSKNCPIFCTWHPHILDIWFFTQKNWCWLVVLAVWGYLFIPHIFKTLSESWAGSEDFGAFEIFHFFEPFCIEERWGTLERVQSWQRWEAPVFSGRPSVLIMIRMKWRKAFAAHFN